jgi:hypothetical protein
MKRLLLSCICSIYLIACHSPREQCVNPVIDLQTGYVIQEMSVNNSKFNYTLDQKGDTAQVWTRDIRFSTSDGFKVGTTWQELPSELQKRSYKIPGWGYYINLHEGWTLGFCEGSSCTDTPPADSSKVAWIEKTRK